MKSKLVQILSFSLVLGAAGASPASARTVKVKVGTIAPEGSIWHNALSRLAQRWREASGGKVRLKIYPGGVVGDEGDMVRKMRIGQLHMAGVTGVGLSQITRSTLALQVPMMIDSYAELDFIRARAGPKIAQEMKDSGFVVLSWVDAGWVHHFSKQPAQTPDALRKLKYIVWNEDPASEKAWRAANFKVVPLSSTDVMSALRTDMAQSFGTTPVFALSSQWFGLAKYMTRVNWAPLNGATIITARVWDRVDEALRPALLKIAEEEGDALNAQVRALHDKAIKAMVERGLRTYTPSREEIEVWRSAARMAYPVIRGQVVPEALFDEVERLTVEYRAKPKKKS